MPTPFLAVGCEKRAGEAGPVSILFLRMSRTAMATGLSPGDDVVYHRLSSSRPRVGVTVEIETETLIRQYAAGEITWSSLRARGFDSYGQVLARLGTLGLRPPMAPMDGPNVVARERARSIIREALKTAP